MHTTKLIMELLVVSSERSVLLFFSIYTFQGRKGVYIFTTIPVFL